MMPPALTDYGIRLRREQPGEHRAACPRCAEAKRRGRDDALAVKVEPDGGATWVCHRCDWRGSRRSASEPWRPASPPPKRALLDPVAEQRRELAQEIWRQTVDIP